MNDNRLQELLQQADERYQFATSLANDNIRNKPLVDAIHDRRLQQRRRRNTLLVSAVFLLAAGVSAWSMTANDPHGGGETVDPVAVNTAMEANGAPWSQSALSPAQRRQLQGDEIDRLKVEIAALDLEARRTHRLVELYQTAESRNKRLAAVDVAAAESLLPQQALAELEIDRAAAITVISADAQATLYDRTAEAAESYRSVLKHFPESHWASVARVRLAHAQQMN